MRGLIIVAPLWVAACTGADTLDEAIAIARASSSGVESQGTRMQGTRMQGTRMQGTRAQGTRAQGTRAQGISISGTVLSGELLVGVAAHASLEPCAAAASGAGRECGWELGGVGTCTPGVTVGAGTGCGLGSASGDSVLRACAGRAACTAAEALASVDDSCAGGAARASFTCPAGGEYTVLVGAKEAGGALDATPAAAPGSFPLTTPISGAEFVGATFIGVDDAGVEHTIMIDEVAPDPGDPEILLYGLAILDPATGAWEEYCDEDADGVAAAIPLAGTWDDTGAHTESASMFTFACTSGVLAKCARWGYKPWKTVNGVQLAGHHQACTRMARADYCGDGRSHTTDGTLIDIYDAVIVQHETPGTNMLYEASWTEDGAYCVSKGRWDLDGVTILLECPWRVAVPSLTDLLSGCLVKLTVAGRSAIRTNNDSYLQLHLAP
jgi:hypothetical protein